MSFTKLVNFNKIIMWVINFVYDVIACLWICFWIYLHYVNSNSFINMSAHWRKISFMELRYIPTFRSKLTDNRRSVDHGSSARTKLKASSFRQQKYQVWVPFSSPLRKTCHFLSNCPPDQCVLPSASSHQQQSCPRLGSAQPSPRACAYCPSDRRAGHSKGASALVVDCAAVRNASKLDDLAYLASEK